MSKCGIFSAWQPAYAAHGIPTFPVTAEKKPATRRKRRRPVGPQQPQGFFAKPCGGGFKISTFE